MPDHPSARTCRRDRNAESSRTDHLWDRGRLNNFDSRGTVSNHAESHNERRFLASNNAAFWRVNPRCIS
jgi:hypothetical protein